MVYSGIKREINDSAVRSPATRKLKMVVPGEDDEANESALVNVRMATPEDISPLR